MVDIRVLIPVTECGGTLASFIKTSVKHLNKSVRFKLLHELF